MTRREVFDLITDERSRQQKKWNCQHSWGIGDCSSPAVEPIVKTTVLGEEFGEVCRAVLDKKDLDLRTELVQLAAVAVAWLEGMES